MDSLWLETLFSDELHELATYHGLEPGLPRNDSNISASSVETVLPDDDFMMALTDTASLDDVKAEPIQAFVADGNWLVRMNYPTVKEGWVLKLDKTSNLQKQWEHTSGSMLLRQRNRTCDSSLFGPSSVCRNCSMKKKWRQKCSSQRKFFYLSAAPMASPRALDMLALVKRHLTTCDVVKADDQVAASHVLSLSKTQQRLLNSPVQRPAVPAQDLHVFRPLLPDTSETAHPSKEEVSSPITIMENFTPTKPVPVPQAFDVVRTMYEELAELVSARLEAGTVEVPTHLFHSLLRKRNVSSNLPDCAFMCDGHAPMARLLAAVGLQPHMHKTRLLLKSAIFAWLEKTPDHSAHLHFAFYIAESVQDFLKLCASSGGMDASLLRANKSWMFETSYAKASAFCERSFVGVSPVLTLSRQPYTRAQPSDILPIAFLF